MTSNEEWLAKRLKVREEILDLANNIPSKKILYFFGGIFQTGNTKENLSFWLSNFVFLNLAVIAPALATSFFLDEINIWKKVWDLWTYGLETSVLSIIASYLVTKMILNDLANHVITKINNLEDLTILRDRIADSFLPKNIYPYSIFAWLAWSIAIIPGISYLIHEFVGWGPSIATVLSGVLIGIGFHYLIWSSQIPMHLQNLQYELNNFMPANSELVSRLTSMFNKYLYILAIAFAIFTLETSLIRELVVLSFFPVIGWITITVQFLINRATIREIVDSTKWKTLNQIQEQMNALQVTKNLAEKETAEELAHLMDTYQKVFTNSSSSLDLKTVLSLSSQLMLPLLGLILGNIDKVLAFFS